MKTTILGAIIGADEATPATAATSPQGNALQKPSPLPAFMHTPAYQVLAVAGTALGAYHGYKRNKGSIGWAIGWALLGNTFPFITIPVSLAQGFGKRGGK